MAKLSHWQSNEKIFERLQRGYRHSKHFRVFLIDAFGKNVARGEV